MKSKIKVRLTDKEYQKLSEETGVSQYDFQKLYSMGLLRDASILDLLITHDYNNIQDVDQYRVGQIVRRLAMYYNISKERAYAAITRKRSPVYFCKECGKIIRKSEYTRNNGVCDDCVAKTIELP